MVENKPYFCPACAVGVVLEEVFDDGGDRVLRPSGQQVLYHGGEHSVEVFAIQICL